MSKAAFIQAIASATKQSKRIVSQTLDAFFSEVLEALKKGNKVMLGGVGTFRVRIRKARTGRNPQTGKPITIPAAKVVRFSAATRLRQIIQ